MTNGTDPATEEEMMPALEVVGPITPAQIHLIELSLRRIERKSDSANSQITDLSTALLGNALDPNGGRLQKLEMGLQQHLTNHRELDGDIKTAAAAAQVELKTTAREAASELQRLAFSRRQTNTARISIAVVGAGVIGTVTFNLLSVLHVVHP
jgi:predicted  nucleic acid-binding Zn-ribbon protein